MYLFIFILTMNENEYEYDALEKELLFSNSIAYQLNDEITDNEHVKNRTKKTKEYIIYKINKYEKESEIIENREIPELNKEFDKKQIELHNEYITNKETVIEILKKEKLELVKSYLGVRLLAKVQSLLDDYHNIPKKRQTIHTFIRNKGKTINRRFLNDLMILKSKKEEQLKLTYLNYRISIKKMFEEKNILMKRKRYTLHYHKKAIAQNKERLKQFE